VSDPNPPLAPPSPKSRYVIEGDPVRVASGLRTCVECCGGEYLFVPSVTALKALPAL
jgi:hypothetical protein